jgi:tetratricopeptide (TPR) repeat protein
MARKRVGSALSAYNDALKRVNVANGAISPILHSWTFAGLAEIQAMMGRDNDALQFLQLAFAVFPDKPHDDPCFSYAQCDRSMLILYEGLVFLRLGQPKLAWEAFAEVDVLKPPPPERTRAEFLKHRAYTSLILGNMIQSCIYLEAAARAAQEVNSDLAFSDVYTLYEHMLANWGQEPRVKSLARLFQSQT